MILSSPPAPWKRWRKNLDDDNSFDYSRLIEVRDIVAIPLSSWKYPGLFAYVDADDAALVGDGFKWYPLKTPETFYVGGRPVGASYVQTQQRLHRLLMGPSELMIDHRNGSGLDNTRLNLRFATQEQNQQNRRSNRGSSSRFNGVSWNKAYGKWHAYIKLDGRKTHLGSFDSEVEAARARDAATIQHYGEHGRLNFPPTSNYILGNGRLAFRVTTTNFYPWTDPHTPVVGIPVRRTP